MAHDSVEFMIRKIVNPDAAANRESWLADQPESSNIAANYKRFSEII